MVFRRFFAKPDMHDVIPSPRDETVLTVSLVSLMAIAFTRITDQNRQLKILIDFIYRLLELYAVSEWVIHDAVDCALSKIASASGMLVSEFLYKHSTYIVHHIAISARSRSEHNHAPVVFCSLLDKVDDHRVYDSVKYMAEDLLQGLDRCKQDFCILVMRSMLSFVSAVGRWFSDLKPLEVETNLIVGNDSEEALEARKRKPPSPIADVEHILLRTKHLMSSPHLPLRLLAMRILRKGE
ncbi:hypothetical protein OSTOST_01524, partial [Ostertagia ostertagi]